jgi:hypothetical protein
VKKIQRLAFPIVTAYLWVTMVLFGAIVLETFMVYPNIFADPPESLSLTMDFLSVSGPSDFFPPLGFATWVLGAGALVLSWPVKGARWCILFEDGVQRPGGRLRLRGLFGALPLQAALPVRSPRNVAGRPAVEGPR